MPGQPSMVYGSFPGGVRVRFRSTACDARGEGCKGLEMLAGFGPGRPMPYEQRLRLVNGFNARHAFAKAVVDPQGGFLLSRYEISDYGVSRGWLATSMTVFSRLGPVFAGYVRAGQVR